MQRTQKTCLIAALAFAAGACSEATPRPDFRVIEGVQQLTVVDAQPHEALELVDPEGRALLTLITDDLGQAHFAYIPSSNLTIQTGTGGELPSYDGSTLEPGEGYVIRQLEGDKRETAPLRVLDVRDTPPSLLYDRQKLVEGLNYLEMRDGTRIAATVWLPNTAQCGAGPWPTVINYDGYGSANPDDPPPSILISNLLFCFAGVGVDIRGSGCSGGVFDVFNTAQHADGYDIIEIVARQRFVLHHKVGTVGLSYPGITQLYASYTNPPHLAAIAPMSVIEDPWRQAWPGGIYNSGFTRQWLEARDRFAEAGGGDWSQRLIEAGDTQCEFNQRLRSQNVEFESFSKALNTYPPDAAERRLSNLVPHINVPVFLTGAWQDEQTGSRFVTMLDDFTDAPFKRFTLFNGRHPDGYLPIALTRWAEFLDFFVARRIPRIFPLIRYLEEPILQEVFGPRGLGFEPDRFANYSDYEAALRDYMAEPSVHVLFESGYGGEETEAPEARFEVTYDSWPPPAQASYWYLGPQGTLTSESPAALTASDEGVDHYAHDPLAGDSSYILHDDLFHIDWHWEPASSGTALGYLAEPFERDTVMIGNGGYAELWFASDATDANVEVSLLEVRPDGTEFLVQTGVFAVKHRLGIDPERSGDFLVEYTYAAQSVEYLTPGEFVQVKVPIQPFTHAFRAGTRLRLVIDTPGRDNGFWEYDNPDYGGEVHHHIARDPEHPSRLVLPYVTNIAIPDPAPPCYSLRGIVCREWLPIDNRSVAE